MSPVADWIAEVWAELFELAYTGQFLFDSPSVGLDNANFYQHCRQCLDWRNSQETEIAMFYEVRMSDEHWVCQS